MKPLAEESKLYKEISDLFDKNNGKITLDNYKEAIKIAKEYEKEEIQYVLFRLKYVNSDVETGVIVVDKVLNILTKIANTLKRKDYKLAFIYSVLETV